MKPGIRGLATVGFGVLATCALPAGMTLGEWLPVTNAPSQEASTKYPNAKMLVEPTDMLVPETSPAFQNVPHLRILDVRGEDPFGKGHIRGAWPINVDFLTKQTRQPGALKDEKLWAKIVGSSLGVDASTTVVVYDETVTPNAARV